jgi:UPF0042 nucleotide-binding protein
MAMNITLFSFGFKHGYAQADCVWDVRFLPNPYWVEDLRPHPGTDRRVASHVLDNQTASDFLALFEPLLFFLLDQYRAAGRDTVRLAIGCTGGRHRSVALVEHFDQVLRARGYSPTIRHRDMDKD